MATGRTREDEIRCSCIRMLAPFGSVPMRASAGRSIRDIFSVDAFLYCHLSGAGEEDQGSDFSGEGRQSCLIFGLLGKIL